MAAASTALSRFRSVQRPSDATGIGALRVRDFRLFASAQLVANTGTWIQRTAQDWLVLDLTRSAAAVGVAIFLQCLPALVLGLWGGSVADRYPKRRLLICCTTAMGLLALVLAALAASGHAQLWQLYTVAVLLGLVSVVESPARQALVPELVDRDALPSAISVNSASYQLARIAGPAGAGVLIGLLGTGWTFQLCAVASGLCLGALLLVRVPKSPPRCPARGRENRQWEAVRCVAGRPELLWTLVLVGLMGMLGSNFAVLLPTFASLELHVQAGAFGLLSSFLAVGAIGGALVAGRLRGERLRVLAGSAMALGVLELAVAAAPHVWAFAALLVPVGACALVFSTTAATSVQMAAERRIQGRVTGLYMVVLLGSGAVGGLLTGSLVHAVGPCAAFLAAGLCCLVLGALAVLAARRIRCRARATVPPLASADPSAMRPVGGPVASTRVVRNQACAAAAGTTAPERSGSASSHRSPFRMKAPCPRLARVDT